MKKLVLSVVLMQEYSFFLNLFLTFLFLRVKDIKVLNIISMFK